MSGFYRIFPILRSVQMIWTFQISSGNSTNAQIAQRCAKLSPKIRAEIAKLHYSLDAMLALCHFCRVKSIVCKSFPKDGQNNGTWLTILQFLTLNLMIVIKRCLDARFEYLFLQKKCSMTQQVNLTSFVIGMKPSFQ